MKLVIPCSLCFEKGEHNFHSEVDINNNGVYEIVCLNGHKSIDYIVNEKYEILFDLGLLAINSGFSRESISSFASALERFYEYCVKIILHKNKINDNSIINTWKLVSNQSERQLGAYYFLYLMEFKKEPKSLLQKYTEFRNKVIHKGYIPSEMEALDYAKAIFEHIIEVTIILKKNFQESIESHFEDKKSSMKQQYNERIGRFSIGTTLNSNIPVELLEELEFDYEKAVYYIAENFPVYTN